MIVSLRRRHGHDARLGARAGVARDARAADGGAAEARAAARPRRALADAARRGRARDRHRADRARAVRRRRAAATRPRSSASAPPSSSSASALLARTSCARCRSAVGLPLRAPARRHAAGSRARTRSRNPRRTAATAAALMIGVALVTFVTIFAAGAQGLDRRRGRPTASRAQLIVAERRRLLAVSGRGARPCSQRRRRRHGLGRALLEGDRRRQGQTERHRRRSRDDRRVYKVDWVEGSAATLRAARPGRGAGREEMVARTTKLKRRRRPDADDADQHETDRCTSAASTTTKASLLGDADVLQRDAGARLRRQQATRSCWRRRRRASTSSAVKERAERARQAPLPERRGADRRTSSSTSRQARSTSCSALIYVLLALAVLISLFGIVNTLVLTINERTRELGMLRAIGMSRRQVKQDRALRGGHHGDDRRGARRRARRALRGARESRWRAKASRSRSRSAAR